MPATARRRLGREMAYEMIVAAVLRIRSERERRNHRTKCVSSHCFGYRARSAPLGSCHQRLDACKPAERESARKALGVGDVRVGAASAEIDVEMRGQKAAHHHRRIKR